jgi:hypothetical protein
MTAKQKAKKNDAEWDACAAMYKAVAKYIRIKGGSVAMSEGVQIQQWPDAKKGHFVVGVKCFGEMPLFVTAPDAVNEYFPKNWKPTP